MTDGANGRQDAELSSRYRIFLIDAGWKTSIREAVLDNLDLFKEYLEEHEVFVLDWESSKTILKRHPGLIVGAPMLVVLEPGSDGESGTDPGSHGLCLNLGKARNAAQATHLMRWMCEILTNRRSARRLDEVVRKTAHREGLIGAIKIITDTTTHLVGGE